MIQDDSAYFAKRAEAELEQAQRASGPKAAQAHYHLANAYLEWAKSDASANNEQAT